jgi:hypothetical protein
MGHGIVAYTADLNIRYRFPVHLDTETNTLTMIDAVDLEKVHHKLYHLEAQVIQRNKVCVTAKARFFKID